MSKRIIFVTSHPIQYQVPIFRVLSSIEYIEFTVLFATLPDAAAQGSGFGVEFEWDIPLLEGYQYKLLENVSKQPSVTRFSGCDTPEIQAELRAMKPDVVIVNGWVVKTCLQTLWACKRLGIPCLVRGEANDLRQRMFWKRWLQQLLVRQYAACLYIGKASKEFYEARGVAPDKLFPAPYCIENERFEQAAEMMRGQREPIRQQWSIPEAAVCYLFCGKFEEKKHPLELVESFAQACKKQTGLHLLMVGDGALREQCEERVREGQLPITFAGFLNQSEVVAAYVAADCLVLPSDAGETWGLVVNEAMACGRPALVSDLVGCAADLIEPGVTGDVFRFNDWSELSEIMAYYGSNPSKLKAMGVAARRKIKLYSPNAAAEGIRRAIENAVKSIRASRN